MGSEEMKIVEEEVHPNWRAVRYGAAKVQR